MLGLLGEVEGDARVETALGVFACDEERLAGRLEGTMERGEELEGSVGEELVLCLLGDFGVDFDALDGHCFGCRCVEGICK